MAPMSVTIHELLGGLRESTLDKRDQGDKFERLVLSFCGMRRHGTRRAAGL